MEIKLFSDLIDALDKAVNRLKTLVNLPRAERDKYRDIIDEPFRLIDTTLNMVIIKLGDISHETTDPTFLQQIGRLDNFTDWMVAEREFRLCRSLRVAVRETETMMGRFVGTVMAGDWHALVEQMRAVLASEGEIANFIGTQFATMAARAQSQTADAQALRTDLSSVRAALIVQRQKLIEREIDLMANA